MLWVLGEALLCILKKICFYGELIKYQYFLVVKHALFAVMLRSGRGLYGFGLDPICSSMTVSWLHNSSSTVRIIFRDTVLGQDLELIRFWWP